MVDQAPTFLEMIPELEAWLDRHDLRDGDALAEGVLFVTDGVSFSSNV
jgi:hypothetical protein